MPAKNKCVCLLFPRQRVARGSWLSAALAAIAFSLSSTVRGETERTSTAVDGLRVLRIVMAALTQGRDALFAAVAMNAVRRLAVDVFGHLHALPMRFHLERKTGALTRVLERGRNAIETLSRMVTLNGLPTALEFILVFAVMLFHFDWRYAAITAATIAAYLAFTRFATQWRIGIRRSMNESDSDANSKAIDSLLNYETVKYFSAEGRESARYDRSMARYEHNSVKSYVSLAALNFGQAFIFTLGMVALMALSVGGIMAGHDSIGDFVMLNAMMIQLYQPLNYMGTLYRETKQAILDIEMMFEILKQPNEIAEAPNAPPLKVTTGALRLRMSISPTIRRGRSCAGSASRFRRDGRSPWSAPRAPANRRSRG